MNATALISVRAIITVFVSRQRRNSRVAAAVRDQPRKAVR